MVDERKEKFKIRFEKYYSMLCRIAYGYVSNADDCEDIVQELFVNVWNKEKDLLSEEEFLAYIKISVRNNCLTFLRQGRTFDKVSASEESAALATITDEEEPTRDLNELLEHLLERMSPKCREIFMMSKLQKMKYKEIAAKLDISEKTVESQMGKAIKILRSFVSNRATILLYLIANFITYKL